MVDGINGGNQPNIIKLKGQKQTIDTSANALKNLQMTEQNKALIEMADGQNGGVKDGKLDDNEAAWLSQKLNDAAGNKKLSKRESKKAGLDFDAINSLAKQQEAAKNGTEYVENNGNKSTHIYQSNVDDKYSYRYDQEKLDNGDVVSTMDDGSREIKHKNGSKDIIDADGTVTQYDSKGNKTTLIKDGLTTTFTPDGNKSVTKNADGQITTTTELKNKQEVKTDFEYKDGQTIARETVEGQAGSVTVSEKKDGHTIDTKYASEEDMQNGKPSEETIDAQNPTLKKTTTFTYDDKGNVKAETKDSAGNIETTFKNSKGEEIKSNLFDAPAQYTVKKGDSITKIVTDALKEQGFENPTPDQIKNAKTEFLEANKDTVKTYNGSNPKLKGNKFFYPNDKVNIPNFTQEGKELSEVEVTSKKPSEETVARRKEVQAQLGDDYDVGYAKDGSIEVRDKNGNVLEKATEMANKPLTSNDDDVATMLKSDDNGNKTLDKKEYNTFIKGQLQEAGVEITKDNEQQINKLIDESFDNIDTQKKDGELTQEELKQNAPSVISKLTEDIGNLDSSEIQQTPNAAETSNDKLKTNTTDIESGSVGAKHYEGDNKQSSFQTQMDSLDNKLKEFESKNNIKRGKLPTSPQERLKMEGLEEYNDNLYLYNQMNSWQDGPIKNMQINGHIINGERVTLPNGEKAFKIDGKYYAPDSNYAFPDFNKEIPVE
ncbi:hypothetical protein IJ541_00355 [bacterium]|nr:hypothetical protein [bacterium]